MLSIKRKQQYHHFHDHLINTATLVGDWDAPLLKPVHGVSPQNLIPFNLARKCKNKHDCWLHFYIDDYQFERIWNRPRRYLRLFKKFKGVITFDFSMCLDMGRDEQLRNCQRNKKLTYWLQENGISILINVTWGTADTLKWAFDGFPEWSEYIISTQSCLKNRVCKQAFLNGLHEFVRQKHPSKLYVYGQFYDAWRKQFSIPIITLPTYSMEQNTCRRLRQLFLPGFELKTKRSTSIQN